MSAERNLPITHVPVRLLGTGDKRGYFARQPGERAAAHKRRLLAYVEQIGDGDGSDKDKALRYAQAMASGAKFPPIFVLRLAGEWSVQDGQHRVAAAALCGRATIPAVVIDVASSGEADRASGLFHYLELDRGIAARTAMGAVVAAFGRRQATIGMLCGSPQRANLVR